MARKGSNVVNPKLVMQTVATTRLIDVIDYILLLRAERMSEAQSSSPSALGSNTF